MEYKDQDIRNIAVSGRLIEAIRQYRERYQVSLAEAKRAVEALVAAPPVVSPEDPQLRQEAEALLKEGKKIEAIKLYRDKTGMGLKEAKDAVEVWQAELSRAPAASDAPVDEASEAIREIEAALRRNQKIAAIKIYREYTGAGLKEAKDAIEAWSPGYSKLPARPKTDAPPTVEAQSQRAPELKEIDQLVRKGKKLEAIKQYRLHTGLFLKECKDAIDAWVPGQSTFPAREDPVPQETGGSAEEEIDQLIRQGNKIEAIKRYREIKGVGLKEAKDAIDNWPSPGSQVVSPSPAQPFSETASPTQVAPPPLPSWSTEQYFALEPESQGPSPFDDPDFCAEIEMLLRRHLRVEAIRRYREKADVGLGEAMDAIDAFAARKGL